MCSAIGLQTSLWRGCPIGNLRDHGLDAAPPERFAGLRVLHRTSAPRHPPRTLTRLFCLVLSFVSSFPGRKRRRVHPLLLGFGLHVHWRRALLACKGASSRVRRDLQPAARARSAKLKETSSVVQGAGSRRALPLGKSDLNRSRVDAACATGGTTGSCSTWKLR
jgi:hypothetical protein